MADVPGAGPGRSRRPQADSLGAGPMGVTDLEGDQDAGPKGRAGLEGGQ